MGHYEVSWRLHEQRILCYWKPTTIILYLVWHRSRSISMLCKSSGFKIAYGIAYVFSRHFLQQRGYPRVFVKVTKCLFVCLFVWFDSLFGSNTFTETFPIWWESVRRYSMLCLPSICVWVSVLGDLITSYLSKIQVFLQNLRTTVVRIDWLQLV